MIMQFTHRTLHQKPQLVLTSAQPRFDDSQHHKEMMKNEIDEV